MRKLYENVKIWPGIKPSRVHIPIRTNKLSPLDGAAQEKQIVVCVKSEPTRLLQLVTENSNMMAHFPKSPELPETALDILKVSSISR